MAVLLAGVAGQAILKGAKRFLAGKSGAKLAQVRAKIKSGKALKFLNNAKQTINKITSSDMGENSDNPIRSSSKSLVADGRIIQKSQADGIVLGGSKSGGGMGLIIAAVAALILLPAILKKR